MLSLASIGLVWPDELHAQAQMRGFVDELAGCTSVNEAFLSAVTDDPDDGGLCRPDLPIVARDRLRAWGADDDAVARAAALFAWLLRNVIAPGFPELPVEVPEDFAAAGAMARALQPHREAAQDTWLDRDPEDTVHSGRAWDELELIEYVAQAAEYLGYLPRRINLIKFKPRLVWSSRPLSLCGAVASSVGIAFTHAVSLRADLGSAVARLGHSDHLDAGVERRAREALHAAGVTEFGTRLEQLAVSVVRRYDAASVAGPLTAVQVAAAVEDGLPSGHEAVELITESPQLSGRPIPPSARTFAAAAEDVLARAMLEVAAHLHGHSAGRRLASESEAGP